MEWTDDASQGWTLTEYVEIVRRRKWAVLEVFGLVLAVGVLATVLTTPIYRARATLLVRATSSYGYVGNMDTQNPLMDLLALAQPETVETQIEVLQSEQFLAGVRQKSGGGEGTAIKADRVGDTNVIEVTVEGSDARRAARVANTAVDEYLEFTRENSLREIRAAKEFVAKQHEEARGALTRAERALIEFRVRQPVAQLATEQENRNKELLELEARARENTNALTRISAQLRDAEAQLAREPTVTRVPVGSENPRRLALETRLTELEAQRMALLTEYREQTRPILNIDAQIEQLKARLAAEPRETVTALAKPNPVRDDLRARVKELQRIQDGLHAEREQITSDLAARRQRAEQLGPLQVHLAQLDRERDATEKSYRMLDEKLQDLTVRENARRSSARVLERAEVPRIPVRPRKSVNLMIAGMLGLMLGFSAAFLQEYLDDRVTTPEQVDRMLGLPVLGYLPLIPPHQSPLMTALPKLSPIAECYRALRSAINFAAVDHPLRTLLVASAEKGAGKSLTAMNMAIAMAMDGRRVILVDADLRRPQVHRMMGWEKSPGLTEVLVGTREVSEALREHPDTPGLRVVTSGEMPPNPAELLNSGPMEELIAQLVADADIVILDSPASLPVTDATLLSPKVDGVLIVADIGNTRRAEMKAIREQFERSRARLLGLVFNKVTRSSGGNYRYYYRDYYDEDLPRNGHGQSNGQRGSATPGTRARPSGSSRTRAADEEW